MLGGRHSIRFESFVNSERCKTGRQAASQSRQFESFVNSERCKTPHGKKLLKSCLRALLIQKDVKPLYVYEAIQTV